MNFAVQMLCISHKSSTTHVNTRMAQKKIKMSLMQNCINDCIIKQKPCLEDVRIYYVYNLLDFIAHLKTRGVIKSFNINKFTFIRVSLLNKTRSMILRHCNVNKARIKY